MQWWNDFVDWLSSDNGQRIVTGVVLPFIAIVIAAIIGAAIGRGATRRLVDDRARETRANAVAALIAAGQSAAQWESLSPTAKEHSETLAAAADVSVRLLPVAGAGLAADWAEHQLHDMRTNSVSYSFQADQTLTEFRDRLITWLHKPNRAKKIFSDDVDRWRYETTQPDPVLVDQQRWADEQFGATVAGTNPAASTPPAAPVTVAASTPVAPVALGESTDPNDPFAPTK